MAELTAPMPVMPITGDCRIQFEAIDPSTGAAVAGVLISQAVIYAEDQGSDSDTVQTSTGPFMFVPGVPDVGAGGSSA